MTSKVCLVYDYFQKMKGSTAAAILRQIQSQWGKKYVSATYVFKLVAEFKAGNFNSLPEGYIWEYKHAKRSCTNFGLDNDLLDDDDQYLDHTLDPDSTRICPLAHLVDHMCDATCQSDEVVA